ncbi:DUF4158 domain-containing protein (plasmid) [Microbulbifer sp. MKSA007]|nr:DUF4158 domain-containing protein [Microbulbifer sp. MKSA007]
MGNNIHQVNLSQAWSLSYSDMEFLSSLSLSVRLEAAVQLKFICLTGYFTSSWEDIGYEELSYIRAQLDCSAAECLQREYSERTARRYRTAIIRHLGLRHMKPNDRQCLIDFVKTNLCPKGMASSALIENCFLWCRDHQLQPPAFRGLNRLIRSTRREFLEGFLKRIADQLPKETTAQMEVSLAEPDAPTGFSRLKDDIGAATLDNILAAMKRLQFAHNLQLPAQVLKHVDPPLIEQLVRRVVQKRPRKCAAIVLNID